MASLYERMAALELALQNPNEVVIPSVPSRSHTPSTPIRHSTDHRFDRPDPAFESIPPAPTPSQERRNPFDTNINTVEVAKDEKDVSKYYDSVAAAFGLGILDDDEFVDYTIYDASFSNMRVVPVKLEGRYYYVEHRFYLPSVPGVVLHEGPEKTGKCLGVAHIPITGQNSIGIGDMNDPNSMVWEKMGVCGFWTHMKYAFVHHLPNREARTFNWIRTRNNILDDQGDLVLIEEKKEGLVLAEYTGKGLLKWKKRGRLRVRDMPEFGPDWEVKVLVSWASVVEVCDLVVENGCMKLTWK